MEPERWARLQALFDAALERPAAERGTFLDGACGGDEALRVEVESLLRAEGSGGASIGRAVGDAARSFAAGGAGLAPGDRLGPYEIVRELGHGGMGTVHLAVRVDDVFRKQVAIKVVRGGLATPGLHERFVHERRILARLDHPHIARVLDGGETEQGLPWLALEYVEGEPLDRWAAAAPRPLEERLRLFGRICEAVHYAHRNLVVHRDLKPGNVLVQPDGTPRLLDFGIARLLEADPDTDAPATLTGLRLMTPAYASPEQVRGEPVTTASDVFSLGVMLYELLAGVSPWRGAGGEPRAVERAIVEQDPGPPSVAAGGDRALAGDLDAIVLKAIRKEPEARYESAATLAEDLRRHHEGLPVAARRGTWRYLASRIVRRHRAGVAAAAAVVLVLAASAAVLAVQAARLARERDRANEEAETAREVANFMAGIFEVSNPEKGRADQITARELLDRGAARVRDELHDRPLVRARMLAAIGTTYRTLGLYDSAAARIGEALEIRRRELAPGHPDVAASLNQRGLLALDRGRLAEARTDLEASLRLREAALGSRHPEVAQALLDLGIVLTRQESLDSALVVLERSREVFEGVRDSGHADVALVLNSLAVAHARRGEFGRADTLLHRVLAIRERAFGATHPRVGELLNNLGTLAARRGDNEAAAGHLRRAHDVFRAAMGEDHPQTLTALANLAAIERRLGRVEHARELQERVLALDERSLGPDHPNVANDCTNLSRTLLDLGERGRAVALLERAHGILSRAHGARHPAVARLEVDLAELGLARGDRDGARRLARRAREALLGAGRADDPAFARAAKVLEATGGP